MGLRPILIAALLLTPMLSACGYKGALTRLEPPDPALTREQLAQALYRLIPEDRRAGLDAPTCFCDVPPSIYSRPFQRRKRSQPLASMSPPGFCSPVMPSKISMSGQAMPARG